MINIDALNDDEKLAALESIHKSIAESKEIQRKKITTNVELIVKALKKIEADLKQRYDETGNLIANLKSGEDGRDGRDGKDGKDGRAGKDGAIGPRGYDGLPGRNGLDGKDGVSITDAHIDFDGSLIISLSTGRVINVGEVVTADIAEKIKVITNGGGTSQYVLDTLASLQAQISGITSGLSYKGTWNASTNTPTLTSSVGTNGFYYIVSVAGSTNLNGVTDWQVGDWAVFNGTVWQKLDQTDIVTSVAGRTGAVVLTTADIGGLGTIATQAANNVTITGGSISGITDLAIADGGTGASTAANARTNLGLVIGTDVLSPTGSAASLTSFPTFNQNTTGTAANVTGTVAVANGGTGATIAATARTNLGATTVGANVFTLTNPSAITFPRFNADNTVSALDAATFRTAIGAGTSSTTGTVTSVGGTGTVSGISLSGTVTSSGNLTLGGTLDLSAYNAAGAFTTLSASGAVTLSGGTANGVAYLNGSKVVTSGSALTFDGTTLVAANFADSSLTSGRVTYATTAGNLTDSANLLYSGTDLTVYGITVGRGAGAVSTNTAVGGSALNANTTGSNNTVVGQAAMLSNTTGASNTAVGQAAMILTTTGSSNTAMGVTALSTNTTGGSNTALGAQALASSTTASNNTAVGYQAAYSNTTGTITAVGYRAGFSNTTGDRNAYFGGPDGSFNYGAGYSNTTGSFNSGFGSGALASATTASGNSAVGYQSLFLNTTGASNVAVGQDALRSNTTASNNTAVGYQAGYSTTTGEVTAFGASAGRSNTTGNNLTAIGSSAAYANTTGSGNTAIGQNALYTNTTGINNTMVGYLAGNVLTNNNSTFIGNGAGSSVTTGTNNTILGRYSGNQGSLDIRTASNYVVLSDGDGNPRAYINNGGSFFCIGIYNLTTANASNVYVDGNGTLYRSTSALKYKQDIRDLENIDIDQIRAVRYKSKGENDDQTKDHFGVIADEVDAAGIKELVTYGADGEVEGFQYERLTVVLLKAMQELKAEFNAYKASHP